MGKEVPRAYFARYRVSCLGQACRLDRIALREKGRVQRVCLGRGLYRTAQSREYNIEYKTKELMIN